MYDYLLKLVANKLVVSSSAQGWLCPGNKEQFSGYVIIIYRLMPNLIILQAVYGDDVRVLQSYVVEETGGIG